VLIASFVIQLIGVRLRIGSVRTGSEGMTLW
jgi:hypothetical protein